MAKVQPLKDCSAEFRVTGDQAYVVNVGLPGQYGVDLSLDDTRRLAVAMLVEAEHGNEAIGAWIRGTYA